MSGEGPRGPVPLPQVEQGLGRVRAVLRSHGGDVQVTDAGPDGAVTLEFVGACRGCPAKAFTYAAVVRPALERTEGVTAVHAPQVKVAPAVLERIAAASGVARASDTEEER